MGYFNILPLLIGEIKIETSKYVEDLNRILSCLPFSFRMKTNFCHGAQLFGLTPLLPFWLHFMRLPPSFRLFQLLASSLCKYEECFHAGGPSVKNNVLQVYVLPLLRHHLLSDQTIYYARNNFPSSLYCRYPLLQLFLLFSTYLILEYYLMLLFFFSFLFSVNGILPHFQFECQLYKESNQSLSQAYVGST